ncbi:methyltransferase domain-containing protein [Candidatus Nephthysia bennettiae]|uniref:Protein-L-isoaspartate O-methyltransferase n=1 Tax=Candidatus Nephthysia bennettiae TaxID=3127016 RepID=A0A934K4R9_9BACT|nr:methyltransferase domain-containing protein [Candidatus Dormibacteraeota bacterium]MBJ7612201.1 methyltransferase domain-containing protein [Candidatus Dormibacteraeota bacterium]
MRDAGARRRNRELVAHLQEAGVLTDPAVAAAFQSVLRHQFLPGRRLAYVYEDTAIPTKTDERGLALSSSSQPAIMALMLQQLALQPGQRVLEIGAGTGYNAALMARLVSPGGAVYTLDIDEEVCAQARANLGAAGVEEVQVVDADGAAGWPEAAPFDRLIVTASADDLAPAWPYQLLDEGRLVVPLALAGPAHLCVAFVKRGRVLESDSLSCCGFLPMRGEMGFDVRLAEPDGTLPLPGRPTWISLPAADMSAGFKTWLALTRPGFVQHRLHPEAPLVFGLRDERGTALAVPEREALWIYAFGEGQEAAGRLLAAYREWAPTRPNPEHLTVAAYPTGEEPAAQAGQMRFARPRFTFLVTRP